MFDTLRRYAIQNIWCSAEQDKQAVLVPQRVTRRNGVTTTARVMLDNIKLPTLTDEFHIYQIGQIPTPVFGIDLSIPDQWIPLEDVCNTDTVQLNLYTNDGVEYPKCLAYTMLTSANNMIIAVINTPELSDLRDNALYLRFYSNAYRESARSNWIDEFLHTRGIIINNDADKATIYNVYLNYKDKPGAVRIYWNGKLSDMPGIGEMSTGDIIEVIYDAAVHRILDFPVKDLKVYTSTLDNKNKYLIHPYKLDLPIDSIFYRDDLEIYLLDGTSSRTLGVYMHHNREDSVRMLTHKDYGISTEAVELHADALGKVPEDCVVRVYFRHSGYERDTITESNYIRELYKLSDDLIVTAMTSTVNSSDIWRAERLESSNYTEIMRSAGKEIQGETALKALGYNSATECVLDAPIRVKAAETVNTPPGFMGEVLMIKQDYNTMDVTVDYINSTPKILNQDMYSGVVNFRLSSVANRDTVHIDEKIVPIDTALGFNCYKARRQGGQRTGDWVNVTGSSDYDYIDGKVGWLIDHELYTTAVVAGDFTAVEHKTETYLNSKLITPMSIVTMDGVDVPCAEEFIIVNGMVLIKDLDYFKGSNGFIITNKELASQDGPFNITIIKSGMESNAPKTEFGFVKYNTLSHNNRYDIHEGILMDTKMNGKIVDKCDLTFVEGPEDKNMDLMRTDGSPYELSYYRGPIPGVPWTELEPLRDEDDATIAAISPYLYERVPQPETSGPVVITNLYEVYSPFIDTLARHMNDGRLTIPKGRITNDVMEILIKDYMYLLDFEPSNSSRFNPNYVGVHPTSSPETFDVELHEYQALQQIIDYWLDGKVLLTNFVGVK